MKIKNVREHIKLTDTVRDIVMKLAEGNPGAITAIGELSKVIPQEKLFMTLLDLDDMGMRGASIWLGFKYYCERDSRKFLEAINNRDEEMVKYILSQECHAQKYGASSQSPYPEHQQLGY